MAMGINDLIAAAVIAAVQASAKASDEEEASTAAEGASIGIAAALGSAKLVGASTAQLANTLAQKAMDEAGVEPNNPLRQVTGAAVNAAATVVTGGASVASLTKATVQSVGSVGGAIMTEAGVEGGGALGSISTVVSFSNGELDASTTLVKGMGAAAGAAIAGGIEAGNENADLDTALSAGIELGSIVGATTGNLSDVAMGDSSALDPLVKNGADVVSISATAGVGHARAEANGQANAMKALNEASSFKVSGFIEAGKMAANGSAGPAADPLSGPVPSEPEALAARDAEPAAPGPAPEAGPRDLQIEADEALVKLTTESIQLAQSINALAAYTDGEAAAEEIGMFDEDLAEQMRESVAMQRELGKIGESMKEGLVDNSKQARKARHELDPLVERIPGVFDLFTA